MVHIVLVRHGESSANAAGILAGRLPDIALTEAGAQQIRNLVGIFPWTQVTEMRHSTIQRCCETAELLLGGITAAQVRAASEFAEVDYGEWAGKTLAELKKLPDWQQVAVRPSAMSFPGGETLGDAAARAVAGVEAFVADLRAADAGTGNTGETGASEQASASEKVGNAAEAGSESPPKEMPVGVVVAHGDIIKAILAAALGMPLDDFQRIAVAPGSFSEVLYPAEGHPTVTAMSVTARGRTGEAGVLGGGD